MKLTFLPNEKEKYPIMQSNWNTPIRYKVSLKVIVYYPVRSENIIQYTIAVGCKQPEEYKVFQYLLEKEEVSLNHQKSQNTFDQIALSINEIFNKQEYVIGYTGEVVELLNQSEIEEKWKKKKKYLLENYKGQLFDQLIKKTDQRI